MEFNIAERTIFMTLHGSHAYGMSREGSDVDIKGVAVPPVEYFHGFHKRFEQFEGSFPRNFQLGSKTFIEKIEDMVGRKVPSDEQIDSTVYDIRKFLKLASDCNPNIIEVLFTEPHCHIISTPAFDILRDNRNLFLSQKAKFRFCGYAFSQLKRIRTHRHWLMNPPKKKPTRADFGLPERSLMARDHREAAEGLIKKKVEEWVLLPNELPRDILDSVRTNTIQALSEMWDGLWALSGDKDLTGVPVNDLGNFDIDKLSSAAGKTLGYSSNFLELLDKERRYKGALKNYNQYQEWKKNRNPVRAAMEAKYQYDCKHASHLVRLLRMAEEIMVKGEVVVCRPDANFLKSIRNGALEYGELIGWADEQQKKLDKIYEEGTSPLPYKPDYKKIDGLCIQIVESMV